MLVSAATTYTREPNQPKPSLPSSWDSEWSHEYDRWYYVNEKCAILSQNTVRSPLEGFVFDCVG